MIAASCLSVPFFRPKSLVAAPDDVQPLTDIQQTGRLNVHCAADKIFKWSKIGGFSMISRHIMCHSRGLCRHLCDRGAFFPIRRFSTVSRSLFKGRVAGCCPGHQASDAGRWIWAEHVFRFELVFVRAKSCAAADNCGLLSRSLRYGNDVEWVACD